MTYSKQFSSKFFARLLQPAGTNPVRDRATSFSLIFELLDKKEEKDFLVVVGRFGVKWPIDKLAAIIVHELVGHGLQHLRGRTGKDRKIDKECEALIYEEKAYQDFNTRRDTRDMQQFRKSMRTKWCADFQRYLTTRGLNSDKVWNHGKPNVRYLLNYFNEYITHLRNTGISGNAVAAAKETRERNFAITVAKAETSGSIHKLFWIGRRYLRGIGAPKNPEKGAKWLMRAAKGGHAQAQHTLGVLFFDGYGVGRDLVEAYKWLTLSSKAGYLKSTKLRQKIKVHLTQAQIEKAEKLAATWKKITG